MKRIAAVMVLLAAVAGADDVGPRLEFAEKDFLFDAVMVGTPVTHAFKFKNTGNADLIIRRVDPTCGCTVSKFPHEAIKPGGEGSVELTIDTSEKMGACLVRATVYSNDAKQQAIGPNTSLLEMKGEVTTCYKLMPLGAYYGPVLRGRQPIVREVRAPGSLDAANGFKITSIDIPVDWIQIEQRDLSPAELSQANAKHGYSLKVSVLPHVPPGEFREWVVVHTDVKTQPSFKFPIVGSASGPVKANEAVLFGPIHRGAEPERIVPLERIDNQKGISILSIDYDRTRLDIASEVIVEGVRTDLRIKVRPDAPLGPFSSYVTVKLDLPEQPLAQIAVLGDVLPRVQADPPLVLLHAGDKEAHFAVPITRGGKLVKAECDGFDVTVSSALTPVVKLAPKKPLEKGQTFTVKLTTDVPGEETLRVPVEVR